MWWRNRKKLDDKPLEETTQPEESAGVTLFADQGVIDLPHEVADSSVTQRVRESDLVSATGLTKDTPSQAPKVFGLARRGQPAIQLVPQSRNRIGQNSPRGTLPCGEVATSPPARKLYFSPGQYAPATTPGRSFLARPSPLVQPDTRPIPIRQRTQHLKPLNKLTVKSDSIPSLICKAPSPTDTSAIRQQDATEVRSIAPRETHLDIEATAIQQPDQPSLVKVPSVHIPEPALEPPPRSDLPLPDWLDQATVTLGRQAGLSNWAQEWLRDLVALWPAIGYHAVRQYIRDDLNLDAPTKTAMQRVVDRLRDLTTKN